MKLSTHEGLWEKIDKLCGLLGRRRGSQGSWGGPSHMTRLAFRPSLGNERDEM